MSQIGCHVSAAGGIWKAPKNARDLGCETFQIFTRSPQGGPASELTTETLELWQKAMEENNYTTFVIHAPYILNFGSSKPTTYHGSITLVRGELDRGTKLKASYVMFHPGSFKDLGQTAGMKQAQLGLQKVLDGYQGMTKLLIEISAGAGEIIGDTFEELAELMDPVKKHPGFGGICYDTQHGFASGYDIRTKEVLEATFKQFDKVIGLDFLKMSHVNDSKIELGGKKDRHEHIGQGLIGEKGFFALFQYLQKKKLDLPLILETEHDTVQADINKLMDLRNKSQKLKG